MNEESVVLEVRGELLLNIWYHLIYWMFAIIECLEDYSTKGERYFEEDILKAYLSKIYSTKGEIISLP